MITPSGPSRDVSSLVAAVAVVVVVAGAILAAGVERPPDLPRLAEHPRMTPPVSVAWSTAGDRGTCLHVTEPDGAVRSLGCVEGPPAPLVAWDDRGILQRDPTTAGDELVARDPTTGEPTGRRAMQDPANDPWTNDVVTTDVAGEDRLEIRLADAPEEPPAAVITAGPSYHVRFGATSPDGAWLALVDAVDRLLVLPLDDEATEPVTPVVWAEPVAADQLVWEGSPPR